MWAVTFPSLLQKSKDLTSVFLFFLWKRKQAYFVGV